MQVNETIHINQNERSKIELFYEGDNIYTIIETIHPGKEAAEETSVTLTREELFDIMSKVFPNM